MFLDEIINKIEFLGKMLIIIKNIGSKYIFKKNINN